MQGQHDIPGSVFPRQLSSRLATAVAARDCWIEDADGHRFLDASGGPLVVNIGHGHPEVARAVHDQILQCDYVHPTMFTGEPVEALAETVSGATNAAAVPPPGYWRRIREICDRYGVLLILDEVFCGLGRTGRWFASEHHDVVPDIVALGKGLSGGAIGLSAIGIQQRHFDRIRSGQGVFMHGGTFSHHQVACAAGNAVIAIIEQEQLVDRVARLGPQLGRHLSDQLSDHPHVGDIRGVGFMWGIEFVQDRKTRRPFPRQERVTERLWQYLYDQGVLLYKSTGLAGTDGDAMVIGPPFVVSEDDIERVVSGLKTALHHVFPG